MILIDTAVFKRLLDLNDEMLKKTYHGTELDFIKQLIIMADNVNILINKVEGAGL